MSHIISIHQTINHIFRHWINYSYVIRRPIAMILLIHWKKVELTSELLIWHYNLDFRFLSMFCYNIHNSQINYSFHFVSINRIYNIRESDLTSISELLNQRQKFKEGNRKNSAIFIVMVLLLLNTLIQLYYILYFIDNLYWFYLYNQ
jgi:hypothetical protein